MLRKRWHSAGAALVVAVVASNAVPAAAGALARTPGAMSTATFTGVIVCAKMPSGKVTFNPPLTPSGTASDVATATATVTDCSGDTSQDGLTIKDARLNVSLTLGSSSCDSLSQVQGTVGATVNWTDTEGSRSAITPSELTFSSASVGLTSSQKVTVLLPGSGGTVTGSGSFAPETGTGGAGIGFQTIDTVMQLSQQCSGPGGLSDTGIGASKIITPICWYVNLPGCGKV
jgi:hypothetical protein